MTLQVPQLRAQLPFVRPCRGSVARLPTFLRLGLPGVVNMFEWWASELNILASGLLPRPALALAALSVYQARVLCTCACGAQMMHVHMHMRMHMHMHSCHTLRHCAHASPRAPPTQTVNAVCFMLPLGASVAGATRVGQALGRGDATAARRAAAAAVALGVCAALGAASLLLLLRGVLPAAFTPDEEVQALVRSLLPLLALYVVADASQAR